MAIQLIRGTPGEWSTSKIILAEGQPAISWSGELGDPVILKIGNGKDLFKDLPSISGNAGGAESSTIYSGTTPPEDSLGKDGDIYYLINKE